MPELTVINELGSIFNGIAALKGSVLYCRGCKASFTNSDLKDVLARDGGSIYLLDGVDVLLNGVKLYNGKSIGGNGGAIYASTSIAGVSVLANLKF
jgi:hypothetical protein